VGLTGAGLEVTEATRAFPHLEHPKSVLGASHYPLEERKFGRHKNATEQKASTRPFTSSPAPVKATRRPASPTLVYPA